MLRLEHPLKGQGNMIWFTFMRRLRHHDQKRQQNKKQFQSIEHHQNDHDKQSVFYLCLPRFYCPHKCLTAKSIFQSFQTRSFLFVQQIVLCLVLLTNHFSTLYPISSYRKVMCTLLFVKPMHFWQKWKLERKWCWIIYEVEPAGLT